MEQSDFSKFLLLFFSHGFSRRDLGFSYVVLLHLFHADIIFFFLTSAPSPLLKPDTVIRMLQSPWVLQWIKMH